MRKSVLALFAASLSKRTNIIPRRHVPTSVDWNFASDCVSQNKVRLYQNGFNAGRQSNSRRGLFVARRVHDSDFNLRLFALRLRKRLGSHQCNVRGIFIRVGRRRNTAAFGSNSFRGSVKHHDSIDALRRRRGSVYRQSLLNSLTTSPLTRNVCA